MALEKELSLAIKASREAGKYLRNLENRKVISEERKDIKLEADRDAEKIILGYLENSDYGILTEESGRIKEDNLGLQWIVDPLDGSLNYHRRIPNCAVSIALWEKDNPLLGVVYDFNRKQLYYGTKENGAFLNDERISVSNIKEKKNGVICTGFPSKTDYTEKNLLELVSKIKDFKKVRLLGSAALSLAYVASGKSDAYSEKGIMFWDVAAGLSLVKFAGGKINIEKKAENKLNVYATNRHISLV